MAEPVDPPQNFDVKLRFGAGQNSRGSVDEIDVIVEEAKSLSKADLDALLSSLGIDLD